MVNTIVRVRSGAWKPGTRMARYISRNQRDTWLYALFVQYVMGHPWHGARATEQADDDARDAICVTYGGDSLITHDVVVSVSDGECVAIADSDHSAHDAEIYAHYARVLESMNMRENRCAVYGHTVCGWCEREVDAKVSKWCCM